MTDRVVGLTATCANPECGHSWVVTPSDDIDDSGPLRDDGTNVTTVRCPKCGGAGRLPHSSTWQR